MVTSMRKFKIGSVSVRPLLKVKEQPRKPFPTGEGEG